ncbi:hypothetical protein PISMIDRAFT_18759 [Pisolithus microcarpus 441]|uniref:Unplaced genomic scaffold scaffold_400, whole genome shotgun sequence n=1 Tax=Pisolithus microcarpus 441 TaxID=765257 RepID=A0A0C9Y639_9AGAM|nr:hypothetical protein PISMIDRAFT_18759 [Pisolithus microcarpus 441]
MVARRCTRKQNSIDPPPGVSPLPSQPPLPSTVEVTQREASFSPVPEVPVASEPQRHDNPNIRPARARRLPCRYEDASNLTADTPTAATPASDSLPTLRDAVNDEETFNIDDISADEEEPISRSRGCRVLDDRQSPLNTTTSDPLMTTQTSRNRQVTTADVLFFFTKCKGKDTVCNECQ